MFISLRGLSFSHQHAAGASPTAPTSDIPVKAEDAMRDDDMGQANAAADVNGAASSGEPAPVEKPAAPAPIEKAPTAKGSGSAPRGRRDAPDDDLVRQTRFLVREMQRMAERVDSHYSEWLHMVGHNDESVRAAVAAMRRLVDEAIPDAQDAVATAAGMERLAESVMPAGIDRKRAVDGRALES